MLNHYVIAVRTRARLRKIALDLGRVEGAHFSSAKGSQCTFVGLYDVYSVEGPLRSGAILGHSSYWSRKTRPVAERQVLSDRKILAAVRENTTSREHTDYLFKAVYLLSAPVISRRDRRTIEAWLLVSGLSGSPLIELAKEIAAKRTTAQRLLKMSADRTTPEALHFCGFAEARKAFDAPVRVGGCFLSYVKHFNSVSRIRALMKKDGKSVLAKQ
ncbi:MAG: hypothetical protein HP494_01180 [Nitrospira sp.]|nr:hypothetical protein [Nitrospira sp.]MBH0194224.1 hypothetical protein [Nitrospira sp.]